MVFQDISLSNLICYLFYPSPPSTPNAPTPHFIVYCCGPVRLRSKHTWSFPLAPTPPPSASSWPFHFCWTFLWHLKSFSSCFYLIQFVCHCHQKCDYSFHWMQQWNHPNLLTRFCGIVSFVFFELLLFFFSFFMFLHMHVYISDGSTWSLRVIDHAWGQSWVKNGHAECAQRTVEWAKPRTYQLQCDWWMTSWN